MLVNRNVFLPARRPYIPLNTRPIEFGHVKSNYFIKREFAK